MWGVARAKYKIEAPAVIGHPDFERVFRVQVNTLEQLVAFLPALWLFALYVSPAWASVLGAVWIVGRVLYAVGYVPAADKRGPGPSSASRRSPSCGSARSGAWSAHCCADDGNFDTRRGRRLTSNFRINGRRADAWPTVLRLADCSHRDGIMSVPATCLPLRP